VEQKFFGVSGKLASFAAMYSSS